MSELETRLRNKPFSQPSREQLKKFILADGLGLWYLDFCILRTGGGGHEILKRFKYVVNGTFMGYGFTSLYLAWNSRLVIKALCKRKAEGFAILFFQVFWKILNFKESL